MIIKAQSLLETEGKQFSEAAKSVLVNEKAHDAEGGVLARAAKQAVPDVIKDSLGREVVAKLIKSKLKDEIARSKH